jgi:hypothetical protein
MTVESVERFVRRPVPADVASSSRDDPTEETNG